MESWLFANTINRIGIGIIYVIKKASQCLITPTTTQTLK